MGTKVPPHSRDAEQAVLGGMLFDERIAVDCLDAVAADDFYDEGHRLVFRAIADLTRDGTPIDLVTVSDKLRDRGQLEQIGGATYLAELLDSCPTVAHHDHWCRIVITKRMRRDLLNATSELYHEAETPGEELEQITERHTARINRIIQRRQSPLTHIGAATDEVMQILDQRHKTGEKLLGPTTGLPQLDKYCLGLVPGKYIVIGARPSQGKSTLGLQLAEAGALAGLHTIFFSVEMGRHELTMRLIARRNGIHLEDLMLAREWETNSPIVAADREKIGMLPMSIDDNSRTIEKIESKVRREHSRGKCDLIIVDYLQHLHTDEKYQSRHQEIGAISRVLVDLAHGLKITVIALCQLSREVDRREPPIPRLSDLKESGDLEADADAVLMLYRPEFYFQQRFPEPPTDPKKLEKYNQQIEAHLNLCYVFISKMRYNKTGLIRLNFFGETQAFTPRHDTEMWGAR